MLLSACAPGAPGSETRGGAAEPARSGPKVLTIGMQREPETFGTFVGSVGGAGPTTNAAQIVHNYLLVEDDRGVRRPQLALEAPSVERGTWRLNPDGTMDTTWKIRPNIKWHDGAPFTTTDLLFSFEANRDPELPRPISRAGQLTESATAPDPLTLVIHWKTTYVKADQDDGLGPLAAHLLEDLYRTDKAAFVNGPHFTTEFVGLGPYRLVRWEQGSHMELARFDHYYLGRPPLDKLIIRFIDDPNTMIASVLAAGIDIALPPSVPIESAVEVRRRWEGTGSQVRIGVQPDLEHIEIQHRPEYARPREALTSRGVRQALYRSIDRHTLVDVAAYGLAPVADSWFRADDPLRPDVQSAIPQFPHDPVRAQEDLAQAGWVKGADSVLVNSRSGERFEIEMRAREPASERGMNVIADYWKALGVEASLLVVPPSRRRDIEYESTRPGILISNPRGFSLYEDRLHSRTISSAASRWQGTNKSGYRNPRADDLFDKLSVTVNPPERTVLHRQALEEVLGDVAIMPLFWEIQAGLVVSGVKASLGGAKPTWDVFQWDRE